MNNEITTEQVIRMLAKYSISQKLIALGEDSKPYDYGFWVSSRDEELFEKYINQRIAKYLNRVMVKVAEGL